jgi:flagellar hook protein FlgE
MGIYNAITTAVSGLAAQSYALENISGNIANSQTLGYKRLDTSFVDLVGEAPLDRQDAGSVAAFSRATNSINGSYLASREPTSVAISGEGFFVVRQPNGSVGGTTTFSTANAYTRRGDFRLDRDGYLRNPAGALVGYGVDPVSGALTSTTAAPIRISSAPIPARPTSTITYQANLPRKPASDPIDAALFPDLATSIQASEEAAFLAQSIQGPKLDVFNASGTAVGLDTRWVKTDSAALGDTHQDSWQLFVLSDPKATGAAAKWTDTGTTFSFDASGRLSAPASKTATIPSVTIDGQTIGRMTLDVSPGLTQYDNGVNLAEQTLLSQNGYPSGTMTSASIDDQGVVTAKYSNGSVLKVAQVALARFKDPNSLERIGDGSFLETAGSGPPQNGLGSVTLLPGQLENSNADVAEEFSKMIVTQQAYSANTKVISTSQQMLQEMLSIVR